MFKVQDKTTKETYIVYGVRSALGNKVNPNTTGTLFLIFYNNLWQWIDASEAIPVV